MDEKQLTIGEINSEIAIHMKQLGYEETTIDRQYRHNFLCTAHFYRATGRIYNNPDITAEYLEMQRESYEREEISWSQCRNLKCHFYHEFGINWASRASVYTLLTHTQNFIYHFCLLGSPPIPRE